MPQKIFILFFSVIFPAQLRDNQSKGNALGPKLEVGTGWL